FQAEDGIRDKLVTGVQTCALPIWEEIVPRAQSPDVLVARRTIVEIQQRRCASLHHRADETKRERIRIATDVGPEMLRDQAGHLRSEERRVGKECRYRGSRGPQKEK